MKLPVKTLKRLTRVCILLIPGFALLIMAIAFGQPALAQGRDPFVTLQTTKGPITFKVFYSLVPYTAGNFLSMVEEGFYNNLSFHRVENWVVQGGDPAGNGSGVYVDRNGRPRYLNLEVHKNLGHVPGAVAMARFGNNVNSASCQFYILKSPMPQHFGQYTVFGQVVDGMRTVMALQRGDRIISAAVSGGGPSAAPAPTSEPSGYDGGPAPRPVDSGF